MRDQAAQTRVPKADDLVLRVNKGQWIYSVQADTDAGLRFIQKHPHFGERYTAWEIGHPVVAGNAQLYPASQLKKDVRRASLKARWVQFPLAGRKKKR